VKGHVLGFLLDARIRRLTNGRRSLDDVLRLAYARHSQERGFTGREFQAAAEEVAGTSLAEWFAKAVASTEELDYAEALDWFGLRFAAKDASEPPLRYVIEIRPDAGEAQQARLRAWLEP
jgi:predicted metalloprotease with PDZ domain